MIGSLRGTVIHRRDAEVVVEVSGLGYRLSCTPATAAALTSSDGEVLVWVHHHRREDAEALFGFRDLDERDTFEALVGTHGIGPSLALAILSVHAPAALRTAVATEDVAALCLVPGVGRKTAARLLVELSSRLDLAHIDLTTPNAPVGHAVSSVTNAHHDVRDALVGLGYGPEEIVSVLRDLPSEGDSGELLRSALQRLATA